MFKFQFTGKVGVVFFKEDDKIIAFCPSLDLTTCGKNESEAEKNFKECLKIYLEETIKHGTLEKDLFKHGWKPQPGKLSFIPPEEQFKHIPTHILRRIQIPVQLPCNDTAYPTSLVKD